MNRRRLLTPAAGMVLALLAGVLTQLPASAQVAGTKAQEVPYTGWTQPNADTRFNDDGVGTWVYVAPETSPGGGQLPAGSYQYLLTAAFDHLRFDVVSLTSGPNGNVAGLTLSDPITGLVGGAQIPYDWSPGRFYFLYTHLLTGGDVGAWVMDWAAGTWAYIGSVHVPAGWGNLVPGSQTTVQWSPTAARPITCAGYPRTDAYWFPPLGYTGSDFTIASVHVSYVIPGDCPSQTEILPNGWIHYRLGADPTG